MQQHPRGRDRGVQFAARPAQSWFATLDSLTSGVASLGSQALKYAGLTKDPTPPPPPPPAPLPAQSWYNSIATQASSFGSQALRYTGLRAPTPPPPSPPRPPPPPPTWTDYLTSQVSSLGDKALKYTGWRAPTPPPPPPPPSPPRPLSWYETVASGASQAMKYAGLSGASVVPPRPPHWRPPSTPPPAATAGNGWLNWVKSAKSNVPDYAYAMAPGHSVPPSTDEAIIATRQAQHDLGESILPSPVTYKPRTAPSKPQPISDHLATSTSPTSQWKKTAYNYQLPPRQGLTSQVSTNTLASGGNVPVTQLRNWNDATSRLQNSSLPWAPSSCSAGIPSGCWQPGPEQPLPRYILPPRQSTTSQIPLTSRQQAQSVLNGYLTPASGRYTPYYSSQTSDRSQAPVYDPSLRARLAGRPF